MTWLRRKYWNLQAVFAWRFMSDPVEAAFALRAFFGMDKPHLGVVDRLTSRIEHHKRNR